MRKKLNEYTHGELISKHISLLARHSQMASNYLILKADVLLIKKRLVNIVNAIQCPKNTSAAVNSKVIFFSGGKSRNEEETK